MPCKNSLSWEGLIVPRNEDPLQPGNHYVATDGSAPRSHPSCGCWVTESSCVRLNNEPCMTRTVSLATGTRALRQKYQECVVSSVNVEMHGWLSMQAAHVIFPLRIRATGMSIISDDGLQQESTTTIINFFHDEILLRADISMSCSIIYCSISL